MTITVLEGLRLPLLEFNLTSYYSQVESHTNHKRQLQRLLNAKNRYCRFKNSNTALLNSSGFCNIAK
jgi:hypothetical protein